jgi:hypothetical protein
MEECSVEEVPICVRAIFLERSFRRHSTPDGEVRRQRPRNAADFGNKDSFFWSQDKPGQWICWDFKALKVEPTHYTIRTYDSPTNWYHLKSWAVEGSDDGASWTEIDRRENNSDLNTKLAVKTFAAARPGASA